MSETSPPPPDPPASSGETNRFSVEAIASRPASAVTSRQNSSISAVMEEVDLENNNNNGTADAIELDAEDGGMSKRKPSAAVTLSPDTIVESGDRPRPKRLHSRISTISLTPRPLRHYLTREVLPHVDHYRNRLSFSTGKSPCKVTMMGLIRTNNGVRPKANSLSSSAYDI